MRPKLKVFSNEALVGEEQTQKTQKMDKRLRKWTKDSENGQKTQKMEKRLRK